MKLEMLQQTNGTVRLMYWDGLEGKDRIFVLDGDGKAYIEEDDDGLTSCDLIAELREMAYQEAERAA